MGSRVPAPPGSGAPPLGGPGAGIGTASSGQHRKVLMKLMTFDGAEKRRIWAQVQRRLAELGCSDEEDLEGRYLPSLAISAASSNELIPAFVKPVTEEPRPTSKDIFSRAYVNCEFRGRPLACMLDTGCDRSVIGRRFIKSCDLEPVRFSLMGAGRNSLKVDGETCIQFSIDGHPMEADVSVSSSMDCLLYTSPSPRD